MCSRSLGEQALNNDNNAISIAVGKLFLFFTFRLLPPVTKLGQGNIFTNVCQEFRPRGGACMAGGVHGGGHVWQGGMHCRGACMAGGGHVWQGVGMCGRGACMAGGVHGTGRACVVAGHAWHRGACVADTTRYGQ